VRERPGRALKAVAPEATIARYPSQPISRLDTLWIQVGGRRVLLCHGSPRRVNEFLRESTSSTAFLDWVAPSREANVVVCSHCGIPWHRPLPRGLRFVNAAAIGRPANDGQTEARYALVEFGAQLAVEFRPVPYQHEAPAAEMRAERLPEEFVQTILTSWWTCCPENLPPKERLRGRH
jgi:diadenosine tetraphosphatase ApaH/serine/threonine PP2A family protein phosphatase